MTPTKIAVLALPLTLAAWVGCNANAPEIAGLESATAALADGRVDESRDGMELVSSTYPGSLEAAVSLHTQGLIAGQFDDDPYTAVDLILQAQEALPDDQLPPELMDRLRIRWQYDLSLYLANQGQCVKALTQFQAMNDLALEHILSPWTYVQGHMAAGDCANELGKPRTAADWYETALEHIDDSVIPLFGVALELKLAKAIADTIGPQGGVTSLQSAWSNPDYKEDPLRVLLKLEENTLLSELGDVQSQITNCHAVLHAIEEQLAANDTSDQDFLFAAPFATRCHEELIEYYNEVGMSAEAEATGIALKELLDEILERMPTG